MSAINTGPIDVNYPVPGVNNNSQGFRTNFAAIKNNLDTAGNEISDLQNKVVLKSALTGTSLNNDMANALISNASVQGFRSTTFNLGNNLANTVIVDLTNGDVQYGTVSADVQIQFARWAPTGTQSNVEIILNVANANANINFPTNVNEGLLTIDNYGGSTGIGGNVTADALTQQLHYRFSTVNCGEDVTVTPVNLPRQTNQIVKRIVSNSTGRLGDVAGDACVGAGLSVDQIQVSAGGSGYVSAQVIISSPEVDGGVQATATASVVAGIVTEINVTESGSGYTSIPTVQIVNTGGNVTSPGSGAQAVATLTESDNYFYYCYRNFNGTSNIWKRIQGASW
jgi:hypothetical protein